MPKPKLAALTVGQSPRDDVAAEIAAATGGAVEVTLRGALDGLSRAEIDRLTPVNDLDTLFTRLPDGDGVTISKKAVVEHGTRQLEDLTRGGYDVTMVLCTGAFPSWVGRFRVVFPSAVLNAAVRGVLAEGRLGVFTPLPQQVAASTDRWRAAGYDARVVALTPNATAEDATEAAGAFADDPPDLLVFDCMSYTSAIKRAACARAGAPGLLAVTTCARMAAELAT